MPGSAVTGGGVVGLSAELMLAKAGHEVTVLERDDGGGPGSPEQARARGWAGRRARDGGCRGSCWERHGGTGLTRRGGMRGGSPGWWRLGGDRLGRVLRPAWGHGS